MPHFWRNRLNRRTARVRCPNSTVVEPLSSLLNVCTSREFVLTTIDDNSVVRQNLERRANWRKTKSFQQRRKSKIELERFVTTFVRRKTIELMINSVQSIFNVKWIVENWRKSKTNVFVVNRIVLLFISFRNDSVKFDSTRISFPRIFYERNVFFFQRQNFVFSREFDLFLLCRKKRRHQRSNKCEEVKRRNRTVLIV